MRKMWNNANKKLTSIVNLYIYLYYTSKTFLTVKCCRVFVDLCAPRMHLPLLTFIPVRKISLKICEVVRNATLALYCTTPCLLSTAISRTWCKILESREIKLLRIDEVLYSYFALLGDDIVFSDKLMLQFGNSQKTAPLFVVRHISYIKDRWASIYTDVWNISF